MHLNRHLAWLAAALLFGACVLPFLVYLTGIQLLGPYAAGDATRFVGNFYGDLARLRPIAWVLLLGPATLVLLWRALVAYAWSGPGR